MLETTSFWASVLAFLGAVWATWEVQVLVSHIIINFVVAVAVGLWMKEFVLARVCEFLYRKILPLTAIYAAFFLFGDALGMEGLKTVAWALLEMYLLADLMENLRKISDKFGVKFPVAERNIK